MSQDGAKRISTRNIDRKLFLLDTFNEQWIFKVHQKFRCQNEGAYEPQMFSIGPYHHGKIKLKESEPYKLRYLKELLARTGESSAEKYMDALANLEAKARRCYAEEIGLSGDDFVEMMCLDGCFVIEFLRKFGAVRDKCDPIYFPKGDSIFQKHWLIGSLIRDMLLFENQLPFFVLDKLFDMTKLPEASRGQNLIDLIIFPESPIYELFPGTQKPAASIGPVIANDVIHILDLVHKAWCSSFTSKLAANAVGVVGREYSADSTMDLEHINSASELLLSGIKFEKHIDQSGTWLDITFENGVIKIPPFEVHDVTECVLRNLIAFEQYMPRGQEDRKCVLDYLTFLDCLIDSSRDVEKLRQCQIITKWLGDDEAVSSTINKLGTEVNFDVENFCYSRIFKQVNEYSSQRWNIWRAHLMRNYFNNPWSVISFLAALVLLLLTLVQSICGILSLTMH